MQEEIEIFVKLAKLMLTTTPAIKDLITQKVVTFEDIATVEDIVDVMNAGGLDLWANEQEAESQDELLERVQFVCCLATTLSEEMSKRLCKAFPPIKNFLKFANNLQIKGTFGKETIAIAESAYNSTIARRNLQRNCDEMFAIQYDPQVWEECVESMKYIWYFTDTDIDALRYFVCQAKTMGKINPSLNKAIYLWGFKKKTGKTTFARALASCLNGDTFEHAGKYESTYAIEQQYADHDLPRACLYNCIILDEAMPRDTRKSYGALKTMLTSNSVNYNPKFKQVVTIPVRRNYIFTSNDDVSEYIQDERERRFYAIEFKGEPIPLEFEEIYNLVKCFVQQCQPREDLSTQKWYDCFCSVDGIIQREKEEVIAEFKLAPMDYFAGVKITPRKLCTRYYGTLQPTREQRAVIAQVLQEYFRNCMYNNGKEYSCSRIVDALRDMQYNEDADALHLQNNPNGPF